ncbi:MAG: NADH-quinone oxidoreductase subunit NuoF [Nitrospirota bacterium]
MERILLRHIDIPDIANINVYEDNLGYTALKKTIKELNRHDVINIIERSGLRGRGGAGFSTGKKLSFIPDVKGHKYVICNASEGEPGTFKDRELIEKNPHQIIEGLVIAAYAIDASIGYIFVKEKFKSQVAALERAIDDAYKRGYLGEGIYHSSFRFDVRIHRCPDLYICGEESALLETIEGKKVMPRLKPPFPAVSGLFGRPTLINNAETLADLPYIINRGGEWFSSIGTKNSTGQRIFSVSGDVNRRGNYELEMGITLREIIYKEAGGVKDGKEVKAVIPGGVSASYLTSDHLDISMDFDSVAGAGSMLGTGGIIVFSHDNCMVRETLQIAKFFHKESCGKCTPCREGTYWLYSILNRIESGNGRYEDIELISDISDNMSGTSLCALCDGAINPVVSSLKYFRDEYEFHIKEKRCHVSKDVGVWTNH